MGHVQEPPAHILQPGATLLLVHVLVGLVPLQPFCNQLGRLGNFSQVRRLGLREPIHEANSQLASAFDYEIGDAVLVAVQQRQHDDHKLGLVVG